MVNNKIPKEAKHALNSALRVLEYAMEVASEKEELEAMIAISDRLMLLYQTMMDKKPKAFNAGFSMIDQLKKTNDSKDVDEDEEDAD